VALNDELQAGLLSNLAGEMTPTSVVEPPAVLIAPEAELPSREGAAHTIHAFDKPGAAEDENPFRH
jgi:hypothetical protein